MRELETTFGGQDLVLAANFKASLEIAEKVGDPLLIMREAALEAMFFSQGVPYEPKWRFTLKNIPQIIYIGLKTAGSSLKLEDVQELMFSVGFGPAKELASEYLALLVGPRPTESAESGGDEGN